MDLGNNRITSLGPPIDDKDATNKKYVDDKVRASGGGLLKDANGNLKMGNKKIVELADPVDPGDAVNRSWVEVHTVGNYLSLGGGSLTANLDMGVHRITSLGAPTDRLDALNKETADNAYIKRGGDNMQGALTMNGNELTDIPNPSGPLDAANKRWVESVLPGEYKHGLAHIKGSPTTHTKVVYTSKVQTITYRTVGNDIQLGFYFKSDLEDSVYSYDFHISRGGHTGAADIFLYGECGGSGFDCKTTRRFWAASTNAGKQFTPNKATGKGKAFLRMYGPEVQVIGDFELRNGEVKSHGIPHTINIGGDNGDTYQYLKQHLTLKAAGATGSKLIGSSLIFVFQPDGNNSTTFLDDCEFRLWKVV